MIAQAMVDEIRKLLGTGGLSQRQIAKRLGVSRGTVNAIALGKRPDYGDRGRDVGGFPMPSGPLRRCPGCGGMVRMPCQIGRAHV
mgnify:CR=1 FL=1